MRDQLLFSVDLQFAQPRICNENICRVKKSSKIGMMSNKKRSAIDEAFERMFGYEWGTSFSLLNGNELVEILGSTRAARIVGTRKRQRILATSDSNATLSSKPLLQRQPVTLSDCQNITLPPKEDGQNIETRVYAGQEISVTTSEATTKQPNNQGDKNIDMVLAQLAGPSKINTIQKTNSDWETFKGRDKQLQEELESQAQGRNAFLVKQDFLNRVDHRKFEMEKEQRNRERIQRASHQQG